MENEKKKTSVMIELAFDKGDVVKHIIGGEKGVVIDYRLYGGSSNIQYCVSFNAQFSDWYSDLEIELYERKILGIGF